MDKLNIMIVGVGGQGTLLASRVLGNVALKKSFDVKVSEVHGMAQRGGSVVTYVRMGQKVSSPIIEKGEADIIIAFEQLEALRWVEYLNENGTMVVNDQRINPMPVIMGKAKYPEGILDKLKAAYKNIIALDGLDLARKCGSTKAVNIVLLAVVAAVTGIDKALWMEALHEVVPAKLIDINLKAFEEGYKIIKNCQ